jgi:hypothetical protein
LVDDLLQIRFRIVLSPSFCVVKFANAEQKSLLATAKTRCKNAGLAMLRSAVESMTAAEVMLGPFRLFAMLRLIGSTAQLQD